jgi:hypothetical protein
MHHKFMVVDGRVVITGSANWSMSGIHGDFAHPDSQGNANALLKITSPELAAVFTEEFELMWGDGPGREPDSLFGLQKPGRSPRTVPITGSQVTVQFSPLIGNPALGQQHQRPYPRHPGHRNAAGGSSPICVLRPGH